MSVEKAKQGLEQANNDVTAELKQAVTARQEAERRRKVTDSQLQETSVRLAETEAKSTELTEKVNKLQVRHIGFVTVVVLAASDAVIALGIGFIYCMFFSSV